MSGFNVDTSIRKEQRTNVTGPIQFQVNFDLIQVDSQIPCLLTLGDDGESTQFKTF